MDIQGFHHLALQVCDLERTRAFYAGVLGLQELARHRREDGSVRSIWLGVPGGGFLALEQVSGQPVKDEFRHPRPGYLLVALAIRADQRAAVLAELARAQVPVVHQTRWTLYFRDPEGNRVALSHHPDDPSLRTPASDG